MNAAAAASGSNTTAAAGQLKIAPTTAMPSIQNDAKRISPVIDVR